MDTSEKGDNAARFALSATSTSFSSRSNDIFANLEILEQKHSSHQKTQDSFESLEHAGVVKSDPVDEDESKTLCRQNDFRKRDSGHRHDKQTYRNHPRKPWTSDRARSSPNKEDGFRRPNRMPARSRRTPDFKVHPDKWTSYSLDDVSERDLSDKANQRAALDFLFERRKERERQERLAAGLPEEEEKFESETAACSKGLISFSRKKSEKKMETDTIDPLVHGSGKSKNRSKFDNQFEDGDGEETFSRSSSDKQRESSTLSSESEKMRIVSSATPGTVDGISPHRSESHSMGRGEEEEKDVDQKVKFKSRKNVRKHIRRRDVDDDENCGMDDG